MCIICAEMAKRKLTVLEAFQNLAEMEETMPESHYNEVMEMLTKELEAESQYDEDINLMDDEVYDRLSEYQDYYTPDEYLDYEG